MPRTRTVALAMAAPMALLAYHPLPALAGSSHHSHATCDGHAATMVVTSNSPHVVHGTSHRDVIEVKSAGHVIHAGKGRDLICGSSHHDTVMAGGGSDV